MWADPSGSLTINFFFAPAYNRLARVLVVRPILVCTTEPVAWDLFDRHAMLCTNPKAPLVAGLGRVGGVTALGSPIGAGSVLNGLTGIALALFAIWRGWAKTAQISCRGGL